MSQIINTLCQYVLANDIQSVRKILKEEFRRLALILMVPIPKVCFELVHISRLTARLLCAVLLCQERPLRHMTLMLINTEKIDVDFQSKQDGNTLPTPPSRTRTHRRATPDPRRAGPHPEQVQGHLRYVRDEGLCFFFFFFFLCFVSSLRTVR